jgi:ribosomal protein S18 acetylase RimI-like enzyme
VSYRCVADNLRESFRVIAESRRGGEIRELHGVSIASAGVTFQMFNAAFLSATVLTDAELEQRINLAALHFQARQLEWAYWVCEDWLEGKARRRLRQILERHGLRYSVELPGMVTERLLPPGRPLPSLEVRRVRGGASSDDFCAIGSACFHVPLSWFREVFENDMVWDRFAAYVGYIDGEPVSTAAIVRSMDTAGIYNVATLPAHQRRGYGEAVMRHALEDTARSQKISRYVLQSTPAGYHIYERMGFRTTTQVAVYST